MVISSLAQAAGWVVVLYLISHAVCGIHELAHLIVATILGVPVEGVEFGRGRGGWTMTLGETLLACGGSHPSRRIESPRSRSPSHRLLWPSNKSRNRSTSPNVFSTPPLGANSRRMVDSHRAGRSHWHQPRVRWRTHAKTSKAALDPRRSINVVCGDVPSPKSDLTP